MRCGWPSGVRCGRLLSSRLAGVAAISWSPAAIVEKMFQMPVSGQNGEPLTTVTSDVLRTSRYLTEQRPGEDAHLSRLRRTAPLR